MKTTKELLKTWDNQTLRNTKRDYQNALTDYNQEERNMPHYKRMVERIKLITEEINDRYNTNK
jgi:hypothetical protein